MSVGILLVTHGDFGQSLIRAAEFILGCSLSEINCISVTQSGAEHPEIEQMKTAIRATDQGDGLLVLTDLAFASPSNTIETLLEGHRARMVSGLNMPMLLRTWNYRNEKLDMLAGRAEKGGIRGIEIIGSGDGL